MSDKKRIEVYACENPRCHRGFVSDPECSRCNNVGGSSCQICKPCPECCGLGIKFDKEKFSVFTYEQITDIKINLNYATGPSENNKDFKEEILDALNGGYWDSIRDTQDSYLK
jgi:hypothetical protein